MTRSGFIAIVGAALVIGMPNYASAGFWDNVPPSWRAQRYQNMHPAFGPTADGPVTTGSINRGSSRSPTRQPRPAGPKF